MDECVGWLFVCFAVDTAVCSNTFGLDPLSAVQQTQCDEGAAEKKLYVREDRLTNPDGKERIPNACDSEAIFR